MAKIMSNEKLESILNSLGKEEIWLWKSTIVYKFTDKALDLDQTPRTLFSRKLTDGKDGFFFLSEDKKILVVSTSWASVLKNTVSNVVNVYKKQEHGWIGFSVYFFQAINPDDKRLRSYNSSKVRSILKRLAANDSEKDDVEVRLKTIHNVLYKESHSIK